MFDFVLALSTGVAVCFFILSLASFESVGAWLARGRARFSSKGIERQWPGALLFLAGALKTGLSLEQALEALMTETPEPLKSQLQLRMGARSAALMPLETQIKRLFAGSSLTLVRAGLLMAHQSGGQAGRLLETCAALLQQKLEMQDRSKALSAQSTASAWVVGLSPFGIIGLFSIFSPDYMEPLFDTRAGQMVLCLVCVLVLVGLWLVHRMARVEP